MKSNNPTIKQSNNNNESTVPSALTVTVGEIQFPEGVETLGEKANFLHAYSVEASKRSTAAAILAGWVLTVARSNCDHGRWYAWLKNNVSFGERTATNYMSLYAQTVGAARAANRRPVALDATPTMEELESAAHDVDGKSLSALYKSTRLIKPSENWGGGGRGQGRKARGAEDEAAELDEIANNPALLYAAAKGPLDELWKLHRERNLFEHLDDAALSDVVDILQPLYKYAAGILDERMRGKSV